MTDLTHSDATANASPDSSFSRSDNPPDALRTRAIEEAIEAATFRRLLAHLDSRKDVQNIDLMNLAGFCRNCLARWYEEAVREHGETITRERARERIYGMPYETWKAQFQTPAEPRDAKADKNPSA